MYNIKNGLEIHACTQRQTCNKPAAQLLYSLCHATTHPSIIDYRKEGVTKGCIEYGLFCLLPEVAELI